MEVKCLHSSLTWISDEGLCHDQTDCDGLLRTAANMTHHTLAWTAVTLLALTRDGVTCVPGTYLGH